MKNSSKLLALGLVLFLGACSATEEDKLGDNFDAKFIEAVKSSEAFTDVGLATAAGDFDTDGKYTDEKTAVFNFEKATSATVATYKAVVGNALWTITVLEATTPIAGKVMIKIVVQ